MASSNQFVEQFKNVPLSLSASTNGSLVNIKVTPPLTGERQGIAVFAILDNSGSMNEDAPLPGVAEGTPFTRLQLVKHSVMTIATTLGPNDFLGIVSFSDEGKIVMRHTRMDEAGKEMVVRALATVQPEGYTNIWDGILKAASLAEDPILAGYNITALLLTDGVSNRNPPRGISATMKTFKMKNRWSLHTFGFGNQLDSALLYDIAEWGYGTFGFIPDITMVGTGFINWLALVLATASLNASVKVKIGDVTSVIQTGPIQFGQARDYVLHTNGYPVEVALDDEPFSPVSSNQISPAEVARKQYIDLLESTIDFLKHFGSLDVAVANIRAFAASFGASSDPYIVEILKDITEPDGQIIMAPRYFTTWGSHYMRSYMMAQVRQACTNFMDKGIQMYGGDLFHEIQHLAETAFCTIKAPIPGGVRPFGLVATGAAAAPVNMSQYFNTSGGCFSGDSSIMMADFSRTPLAILEAGDSVWTKVGPATVTAVVVCSSEKSYPMSKIGNLWITPWHPVLHNGTWKFPADINGLSDRSLKTVYNLVLSRGHIVNIGGTECCTLGHGMTGPIIGHPFFGTDRVIEDLKKVNGWASGRPTFKNLGATKDSSGLVSGWFEDV